VLADVPGGWRNVPTSPQWSVLTGPGGQHRVSYRANRAAPAGVTVDAVGTADAAGAAGGGDGGDGGDGGGGDGGDAGDGGGGGGGDGGGGGGDGGGGGGDGGGGHGGGGDGGGGGVAGVVVLSCSASVVVMEVDGVVRRWRVERYAGADGGRRHEVDGDAGAVTFTEAERFPLPGQAVAAGSLRAPLPGTVVALRVAVGDEVVAGQELLVIEAMKIQHVVRADLDGRVCELPVEVGSTVEVGAVLAVLAGGGQP
jgi:biotin carboxyl carrier protein